jgi:hypothetical protein
MDTENLIQRLATAGPRKPLAHPVITAGKWLLAVSMYVIVIAVFSDVRPDLGMKRHQPMFVMELVGMLATSVTAALAASWLALPDVGQRPWIRYLPFLPLLLLAVMLLEEMGPADAIPLIECVKLQRYDCIIRIVLFSLLPAAWLFGTIQRAAPTRCCWAGSMAALSVASFGYILLRLVDPNDDPSQLIVWHFLPVLIVTMIGMAVGRVYFRRSASWL